MSTHDAADTRSGDAGDTAASASVNGQTAGGAQPCDPASEGWEADCLPADNPSAYQSCPTGNADCGDSPNVTCATYTTNRENAFCAPVCMQDSDCLALPGYKAACNFVMCALLCDDAGKCPHGMSCVADYTFIDATGGARSEKSVCVPGLGARKPTEADRNVEQ